MIARTELPDGYLVFNRDESAPWGHRLWVNLPAWAVAVRSRLAGAYAWQPNNSTRLFEYPWACEQIESAGRGLAVVDVGAGLGGLQFTLARRGHRVHAVDPGMKANGRGWTLDADLHQRIARALDAPVQLHSEALEDADIPERSVDVIVSVSTLEHLTGEDRAAFAAAARRILRESGIFVLTIDLFLNLAPFTDRERNEYGENVDVAGLLDELGAEVAGGRTEELYGFPDFDPIQVLSRLDQFQCGPYPALAQCVVARPRW